MLNRSSVQASTPLKPATASWLKVRRERKRQTRWMAELVARLSSPTRRRRSQGIESGGWFGIPDQPTLLSNEQKRAVMLVEAGSTEETIIEFTAPRLAASMQRRRAVAVAGSDAGAGAGAGSQRNVHAVAACSPPAKRVAERMRCHSRRQPPASHACFSVHSPCVHSHVYSS